MRCLFVIFVNVGDSKPESKKKSSGSGQKTTHFSFIIVTQKIAIFSTPIASKASKRRKSTEMKSSNNDEKKFWQKSFCLAPMLVSAATEVNADNAALPDQKLHRRHEKSPNEKSLNVK